MKSRSLLIFVLIISLAVVPSLQLALAASSTSSTSTSTSTSTTTTAPKSPYSERLDIYTAGDNDYWLASLSPVNGSKAGASAAESVAGVNGYELTAIKTTAATSSSQLFWAGGYDIVKLPFMPDSGVFLNVTATSQSAAQSAASDFGTSLGSNFEPISSSGNNYTFFSPGNFAVIGAIIFKAVPVGEKGLAGLVNATALAAESTPTEILTGVRSGSSFTHTVSFGSTGSGAVGSNSSLLLGDALDIANDSYVTSANATSSHVYLHSLDGLIQSADPATITNHEANFSSSYSISVTPGSRFRPNVTMLQEPPVLTATRTVSTGSASQGDLVSVTVNVKNTGTLYANTGTIRNINVNDNWWSAYPSLLSLSAGNSSFNIPSLTEGQNVSRVYVLKVSSAASEDLTVPSTTVTYSYGVGSINITASTQTNELELRTNDNGPALTIIAGASVASGSPVGSSGRWVVTVTNDGNAPALNLNVLNYTNPTLLQGGTPWTFNTTIPLPSLVNRNLTQSFTLGWTAPDGSKGTLVSNPARVLLSHSGIELPLVQFKLTTTLTSQVLASRTFNATYDLNNIGSVAADNAVVTQQLPPGMVCKSILSGNATCGSSGLTLTASPLAANKNSTGQVLLTFSNDNYIIQPASITTTRFGYTLHTAGTGLTVGAGIELTKTFSTEPVFQGEDDNVTVRVTNQGTLPVYNVSLATTGDGFDTPVSGSLTGEYATLAPSASQSYNYTVKMLTSGNHSTTTVGITYVFGGFGSQYTITPNSVLVYKPVHASASTTTTPVEGDDFSLAVNVQNPSSANVTNVAFSFQVPKGLTIVNYSSGFVLTGRTVTLNLPSLAAGASSKDSLTLKANFDGNINLTNETLTFQFHGTTIQGTVSNPTVTVAVELLLRYELPIGLAVVLTIAAALYMHRKMAIPQAK